MSSTVPTPEGPPQGGERDRRPAPSFLEWLPWEKILIWGLFLLAVYTLRHFFFIIFMTFIISYIMRSTVLRIAHTFTRKERVWLERGLTLICFALLLYGLYEAVSNLGPRLITQAKALVEKATEFEPEKEFNSIVNKTVGAYLFNRSYKGTQDPQYKAEFEKFQKKGLLINEYENFKSLLESLDKEFVKGENRRIREELERKDAGERGEPNKDLEAWFLREKAPEIYKKDKERLISQWEQKYIDALAFVPGPSLPDFKKSPDFEKTRDDQILSGILKTESKDAASWEKYHKQWVDYMVETAVAAFKSSPDYEKRFREFYEKRKNEQDPITGVSLPESFDKYEELRKAHAEGEKAFSDHVREARPASEEDRLREDQKAFELSEQARLSKKFLEENDIGKWLVGTLTQYGESGVKSLGGWIRDGVSYLITIPVQLGLSFLLSFFITLDAHRMRRGVLKLRKSRVSDMFDEIAPGLYNFGRLIGRAFQAQGVIALFNTLLTFIAISFIGIKNEYFLCSIVFLCSFIPVLGVVLSSVPIAVMAIVQPGGNVYMALYAIGAILGVHFIETSILNPKILGDMLHLHPVIVLTVLAVGEHFFKVWGLLLAVPVTVYIIRCVILNEEIPGLIEQEPLRALSDGGDDGDAQPPPPVGSSFVFDGQGEDPKYASPDRKK